MNKEITDNIDQKILSLYPHLDFTNPQLKSQSIEGIKTLLKILKKTAENKKVSGYLLMKDSDIHISGQTKQNSLKKLTELRLLRKIVTNSKTNTERNDYFLTTKGLLACTAFPEYQERKKIDNLIKSTRLKNELVFLLKLYNDTFVRGKEINDGTSPLISVLHYLARTNVNFELESESAISKKIKSAEEDAYLESLKVEMLDSFLILSKGLSNFEEEKRRLILEQIEESARIFSDPKMSLEDKAELSALSKEFAKNALLFFTSQELSIFLGNGIDNFTFEDLGRCTLERAKTHCCDDPKEKLRFLERIWLTMGEILHEKLFECFESN